MLRHHQQLQQLLRAVALAQARGGGGTTLVAPAAVAATSGGCGPARLWGDLEQDHQQQHERSFATRGPSFLDPQGRRAMKHKRQAQQRQRLLREMKGGSSVVAVGGTGDAAAAAAAAPGRRQGVEPSSTGAAAGAGAAAGGAAEGAAAASASGGGDGASASESTAAPGAAAAAAAPRGQGRPGGVGAAAAAADDGADDDDGGGGPGTPLEMQRERSSWLPGWMRDMMPEGLGGLAGGSRRRKQQQQQQGVAAGGDPPSAAAAAAAPTTDGGGEDDADARYANLEKYRDLNLEAFLQHQGEQSDDAPPPPRPPPHRSVPPLSPLRRAYQAEESRRVLYYRARHHVRIVEALRDDERAAVEADPRRAARRERLLRSVAARTGYSPGQVGDCLQAYEALRFRVNSLCDWRASGRRMPRTQGELTAVVDAAKRDRDGQDLAVLLAERRTPGERCPLRRGVLSAMGGRRAVCPQTRLPYAECCGALEAGAFEGRAML